MNLQDIIDVADKAIEIYQKHMQDDKAHGTSYMQFIADATHEKNEAILKQLREEANNGSNTRGHH